MLKTLLYESSDFEIIASMVTFFILTGTLIFWVAFHPKFTNTLNKFVGINTGYYGPVTTLFTFTAAFLGASVWGNFQQINTAIGNERVAIIGYRFVIESTPYLRSSGLDKALKDYVTSALEDEWPELGKATVSPKTVKAFEHLMQVSVDVAQKPELNSNIAGMLVRATEALRNARLTRIGFRFHNVETTRWTAILFLGVLAQLVTMITHLENRKKVPMAAAISIVSILVFSITTLIVLSVNPYHGAIQVSKRPIEASLERALPQPQR
jgi:hypothetical protein